MLNKWAFIFYVCSTLALFYVVLVNSPFPYAKNAWENTDTPILFFPLVAAMIIHIVFTGKMLSQEKFKKVMWVSGYVALGSFLMIFYKLIIAYVFFALSYI